MKNKEFLSFEWDARKSLANYWKHGYDFEAAQHIFTQPIVSKRDERQDYGEDRYIALGNLHGRTMVIVYTERNSNIRIIVERSERRRSPAFLTERVMTI